jgi:hypothetical protein
MTFVEGMWGFSESRGCDVEIRRRKPRSCRMRRDGGRGGGIVSPGGYGGILPDKILFMKNTAR